MTAKLALGAVQFGLAYGIANREGKVAPSAVKRILDRAREAGIDLIDTAGDYGDSEATIGACGLEKWQVVTKLPAHLPEAQNLDEWVDQQVSQSLGRLKIDRLHGLLLHRPEHLLASRGPELWRALQRQKDQGRVARIGYSIYDPAELGQLFEGFRPDLIQSPYNVFDRRLVTSGWLSRLKDAGTEVHTRSAYLQGLLLMPREDRPAWTTAFDDAFGRFEAWVAETGGSRSDAALGFCLATPGIDRVLIGVQSVAQLEEALSASPLPSPPGWDGTAVPGLIDPRQWAKS